MNRIINIIIILSLAIAVFGCKPLLAEDQPQACIKESCFNIEIVQEIEDLMRGLQGRTSLDADAGMLFIFEQPGIYPFWMKDTLIPLDIIWIDGSQKVVNIAHAAQPCSDEPCDTYDPNFAARYVLEVNAGYSQEAGIDIGDPVVFKNFAEWRNIFN